MSKPSISILISTFNWPCYQLASQLEEQIQKANYKIDIIVGEDASTSSVVLNENKKIQRLPHCQYILFTKNNGRAKIRNKLAKYAQGDYLLFIDSDALVISPFFLNQYIHCIPRHNVVYGGIKTLPICNEKGNRTLRLSYEKAAEKIRNLSFRRKHPYSYISAFNILIKKELFMQNQFNEKCSTYGYEDALLGIELKIKKEKIYHIDNPLLHTGIDTNEKYLKKIEQSLETLYKIGEPMQSFSDICRLYRFLHKIGIDQLLSKLFVRVFKKIFIKNLLSTTPSLLILKLYKLGFYCQLCTHGTKD